MKMIKTFLAAALTFAASQAVALGGISISTTQFHSGASPVLLLRAGESATYSLSGTWVGLTRLEKSLDGTNYFSVVSSGALSGGGNSGGTVSGTVYADAQEFYRFFASSWTSGGFVYALADADDAVQEFLNHKKQVALAINDDSITTSNAVTISSNLVVSGTLSQSGLVALSSAALTGSLKLAVKAKAFFDATTPAVGDAYLCSNCTIPYSVCVGTGASLSGFKVSHSATVGCGTNN